MTENGRRLLTMLCDSDDPVPRATLERAFGPDFYRYAAWVHRHLGMEVIERITGDDGIVVSYRIFANRRQHVCSMLD